MKQCIILTIAPPGAGKSTWAAALKLHRETFDEPRTAS